LSILRELWQNNAWLNSEKYTYSYDNNGNTVSGQHYSWSNNSWVSSQINIRFSYNNGQSYYYIYSSSATATYQYITTGLEYDNSDDMNFTLSQNYPNPFNPSTTISFVLPLTGHVILELFSTEGKKVMTLINETMSAGKHQFTINSGKLPSGVYIYRLKAGQFSDSKKLILLK